MQRSATIAAIRRTGSTHRSDRQRKERGTMLATCIVPPSAFKGRGPRSLALESGFDRTRSGARRHVHLSRCFRREIGKKLFGAGAPGSGERKRAGVGARNLKRAQTGTAQIGVKRRD